MSLSTVVDVLLIGAAVVWILARQIRLARVKPRLLVLSPLVLAYFGIRALPASTWHTAADLGLLAVSAVVAVALGLWRGPTIKVRMNGAQPLPAGQPALASADRGTRDPMPVNQ